MHGLRNAEARVSGRAQHMSDVSGSEWHVSTHAKINLGGFQISFILVQIQSPLSTCCRAQITPVMQEMV